MRARYAGERATPDSSMEPLSDVAMTDGKIIRWELMLSYNRGSVIVAFCSLWPAGRYTNPAADPADNISLQPGGIEGPGRQLQSWKQRLACRREAPGFNAGG